MHAPFEYLLAESEKLLENSDYRSFNISLNITVGEEGKKASGKQGIQDEGSTLSPYEGLIRERWARFYHPQPLKPEITHARLGCQRPAPTATAGAVTRTGADDGRENEVNPRYDE